MRYAILQSQLDMPSVESLKRAFRSVSCLTDLDAFTLARDAYGILVKNLSDKDAATLQGALKIEGVATEIVPDKALPPLPPAKHIHRLECASDGLHIYDPLGRPFRLDWNHLLLIAAGQVSLTDFQRVEKRKPVRHYHPNGTIHTDMEVEHVTREERNDHLLLELVIAGAKLRYAADGHKFNYHYLKERATKDPAANFALLVQDLTRHATSAAVNRGAYYFREQAASPFTYPSKNAFYEEITWLLWRLKQARAQAEGS
jgi:hypothetical protein